MAGAGRAVLLTVGAAPEALAAHARTLSARHEELLVALEPGHDKGLAPLPVRWQAARDALAGLPGVWVTPLVHDPALATLDDRCAALQARVGPCAALYVESSAWERAASQLGLPVQRLASSAQVLLPSASSAQRALVVTRAQPFHLGHLALVERALAEADELLLVIAAAQRSHTVRDPFTAAERLLLVRAGLGPLLSRCWLVALPAPAWPAMALPQLAFVAPPVQLLVAHNPVLRDMAQQQGLRVLGLPAEHEAEGAPLRATLVRRRLAEQGTGAWLDRFLPAGTARLLRETPALASRCRTVSLPDG